MRNHYGWRAALVMALLALGCRIGIAQIGPRYVLELPFSGARSIDASKGQVQMLGGGLALVRFQDLSVLALNADTLADDTGESWPAADLAVVTSARGWMAGCPALARAAARRNLPLVVAGQEDSAPKPSCYPMQAWDTLYLRKGATRLRATAMAGAAGVPGVGGFMLELGNAHANYRVYLSAEAERADVLLARLPGADMLLLQDGKTQQLAARRRGSDVADLLPVSDGPVAFTVRRR